MIVRAKATTVIGHHERYILPLMRPQLPDAEALLPYLKKIDSSRHYTNFGPLNAELINRLVGFQKERFSRPVFGVTTSNATLALELLIADLRLPRGSKILLPAFTFVASASAVLRSGHVPVVADVCPESWMLEPALLPDTIESDGIAAVMPVAVFGMPQSASAWAQWRNKTGIPVIIDAAGAFGAQPTDTEVPVAISLHATKSLSTGEGGLVLTEHKEHAERLAQMTNFGIGLRDGLGGTNAKLSEYHAAVGLADFDAWPAKSQQRMRLYGFYKDTLEHFCGDRITFQHNVGLRSPTTMVIKFESSASRDEAEAKLSSAEIQTRRWYLPLIQNHPALTGVLSPYPTPHADDLAARLLGLPFFNDLAEGNVTKVATMLKH